MLAAPTFEGLIIKDPALRGRRPIIAGTGTTVRTIAGLYKLGLSAEDITGELPLRSHRYFLNSVSFDQQMKIAKKFLLT